MTILALDTSMNACSVAVLRDGAPLIAQFEPMDRGHAEALFPMIQAVLADAGLSFSDIGKIAVTAGPGSFTGVRVGIAAARAIAMALGVPAIGVCSLEVMAKGCCQNLPMEDRAQGFAVAHDARRGELYCQSFAPDGSPLSAPMLMNVRQAAEGLAPATNLIAGSGAAIIAREAQNLGHHCQAALPDLLPDAADLANIAVTAKAPYDPPIPLYLRPPDAKPQMSKVIARA